MKFAALDPRSALFGGLLIGLGLVLVLLVNRRPTGVSGVLGELLTPAPRGAGWRIAFLGGLLAGGLVLSRAAPTAVAYDVSRSLAAMAIAGALVGVGTRWANGCTSGHGVCGVGRLSPRSILATLIFLGTGALTLYVIEHGLGGRL